MNYNCKDNYHKNHWEHLATGHIRSIGAFATKGKELCITVKNTTELGIRIVLIQDCGNYDDEKQIFDLVDGEIRLRANHKMCLVYSNLKNNQPMRSYGCHW